ncbi:MAG: hypothetical protein JWN02_1468, partial [Acidobacteria bacterium]|nr:hypothetical protein [Acidobacteriota bacterium]
MMIPTSSDRETAAGALFVIKIEKAIIR